MFTGTISKDIKSVSHYEKKAAISQDIIQVNCPKSLIITLQLRLPQYLPGPSLGWIASGKRVGAQNGKNSDNNKTTMIH